MRHFPVAAALVAIPAISLAATSQAEEHGRRRHNDYYYNSYDTAYEPVCVIRKIRTTDDKGNPVTKTVRICR